jgi:hypothetical protein
MPPPMFIRGLLVAAAAGAELVMTREPMEEVDMPLMSIVIVCKDGLNDNRKGWEREASGILKQQPGVYAQAC